MLTGQMYQYDQTGDDYYNYAWSRADFLRTLVNRGIDVRLYTDNEYVYNRIDHVKGIASNIAEVTEIVNDRIALVKLLKLAGFRYSPMPAKNVFWISPSEFGDAIGHLGDIYAYNCYSAMYDIAFYDALVTRGLSCAEAETAFIFYHMNGAHTPYIMNDNIKLDLDTTQVEQAIGSMKIVFEYLRQLKALGLYEGSLIIIMADHGNKEYNDMLTGPSRSMLFVKPAGIAGAPLRTNQAQVSLSQFRGTVMEGLFGSQEGFGPGYFDIAEDEDVTRELVHIVKRYEVTGDSRDFANWHYIGDYSDKWRDKAP